MPLLEITNVTKDFGGLEALSNVSMQLNDGDIISLIGPNGAGKSSLLNKLTGQDRAVVDAVAGALGAGAGADAWATHLSALTLERASATCTNTSFSCLA